MRITLGMNSVQAANAVAGNSARALEIALESTLFAAEIDPDHFGQAVSTLYDLDHYGVHDAKLVELFDDVCCGCHVNLKVRLRARSQGMIDEIHFWSPSLRVDYYLAKLRRRFPTFAENMPCVTSKQRETSVAPLTREDVERGIEILGNMQHVMLTGADPRAAPAPVPESAERAECDELDYYELDFYDPRDHTEDTSSGHTEEEPGK